MLNNLIDETLVKGTITINYENPLQNTSINYSYRGGDEYYVFVNDGSFSPKEGVFMSTKELEDLIKAHCKGGKILRLPDRSIFL